MARKRSVVSVARMAVTADAKARKGMTGAANMPTADSFQNFQHKLGVGADNALTSSTYTINPITRSRQLLEFMYRGSWLAGIAVDAFADDMTRAGVDHHGEISPEDMAAMSEAVDALSVMTSLNETIKWSRLYGGALAVILIDGQDYSTPLRVEALPKNSFKGLLVLDRWMVEPTLSDLITELGPELGLPKTYRITANAPALINAVVHHTRVIRFTGVKLPYWQALTENMWGLSIIERLYDRMVAYDSASTGAAQLVYKCHQRTFKVKNAREIIATGGKILDNFKQYVEMMRRWQGIEGMSVIDAEDTLDVTGTQAITGLADAITAFGEQLSGALQIPLVRLFGQSPRGFNTGDTDLRNYYDSVKQKQETTMRNGLTTIYRVLAKSLGINLPDGYRIDFKSLWQTSEKERADIAKTTTDTILAVQATGLVSDQCTLKELKQSSQITGIHSNITDEDIERAMDVPTPPMDETDDAYQNHEPDEQSGSF